MSPCTDYNRICELIVDKQLHSKICMSEVKVLCYMFPTGNTVQSLNQGLWVRIWDPSCHTPELSALVSLTNHMIPSTKSTHDSWTSKTETSRHILIYGCLNGRCSELKSFRNQKIMEYGGECGVRGVEERSTVVSFTFCWKPKRSQNWKETPPWEDFLKRSSCNAIEGEDGWCEKGRSTKQLNPIWWLLWDSLFHVESPFELRSNPDLTDKWPQRWKIFKPSLNQSPMAFFTITKKKHKK